MADIFVIVGRGGRIAYSEDGINWTGATSGTSNHLWTVATNGSRWLVGEESQQMVRSPDGIHAWTPFTASQFDMSSLAWNGSLWCAPSASANEIYTSPDTITWTLRDTGVSNDNASWDDICWDAQNGQFVVAGSDFLGTGYVLTSPDGITWATRTPPADFTPRTVAAHGGTIVIGSGPSIGGSTPNYRLAYSTDGGLTWTKTSSVFVDLVQPDAVRWCNDVFMVVGDEFTTTSPDGITWTTRTTGWPSSGFILEPSYGAGLYVIVGQADTARGMIMTSPDLTTWTERTSTTFDSAPFQNVYIRGITYGPSNLSWIADSVIKKNISGSLSADAEIATINFKANAVIYRQMSQGFSADALFSFDLAGSITGRNPHDRSERHFGTMPATLVAYSATETLEDRLRYLWGRIADAEAGMFRLGTIKANAVVFKTVVTVFTANAVAVLTTAANRTLDAIVRRTQSASASADSVLKRVQSASFTADAYVFAAGVFAFTADGIIKRTVTGSFTADAVISTGSESGLLGDHTLGQHELGGE